MVAAAHVDDILWACEPEYQWVIDKLLEPFEIKKLEERNFRFCGRRYVQDDDFTINIDVKDNTEKILPIN